MLLLRACPSLQRPAVALSVIVVALLLLAPMPAQAQFWRQEAQIIVPNEPETVARAFVDSLGAALDRAPDALVRRAVGDAPTSYLSLSNALLDDGVDVRSASHLFISYAFAHGALGVTETIRSVTLIYRSGAIDEPDMPLLHLPAGSTDLRALLQYNGHANPVNLGAITPFREALAFPMMARTDGTQMVRFAGTELREGFDLQRDRLLALLAELIYNEGEAFVLVMEE